jgi:histidyl-tRNA synthetase
MAQARHRAPKGTFDVLPDQERARALVFDHGAEILDAAGFGRIETPAFEETVLFERGVGESTDIVRKEMFTFEDQGGRSMTLRPEATAPICRAYVEHGMHKLPQPVRLWAWGSFFRYERPQEGRFRQFNQIDAEIIGTESPVADAELIVLLDELMRGLGIEDAELRLSSLGRPSTRDAYRERLRSHLREHEGELSEEVRSRIDMNPLRAFDADHEGTRAVMAEAPTMLESLEPADAEHFAAVRRMLDSAGVPYRLDGTLVRGLDYYTRTVFEFTCPRLGAQSGIGGGGRYDGLVEQLGGQPTPGVGWAAGIERILLAMREAPPNRVPDAFVVAAEGDVERAFGVALELRRARLATRMDLAGRSYKNQMKQADRSGADFAVILEEGGGVQLREMASGEQREVAEAELAEAITPGVD